MYMRMREPHGQRNPEKNQTFYWNVRPMSQSKRKLKIDNKRN